MRWTHQLPAYSPISPGALLRGLSAATRSERRPRDLVERIGREFEADDVVLTDSGTSALALSLAAATHGHDRERGAAALPAFGCFDLATAAVAVGVDVVLYDVSPRTLGPDWNSFSSAVSSERVSCAVVVHLYGTAIDVRRARSISRENEVVLVEDAAQGLGGRYRGKRLGAAGQLSVLSFGRGKGLTGGGGGALLARGVDGRRLLRRARESVRPAGRGWKEWVGAFGQWLFGRPWLFGLPSSIPWLELGETTYTSPHPPSGLPAACCGIVRANWDSSFREAAVRRRLGEQYHKWVKESELFDRIELIEESEPGYLRYPVAMASCDHSSASVASSLGQVGVARSYPKPLSRLRELGGRFVNQGESFPCAERLAQDLLTLPTHSLVRRSDLRAIRGFLEGHSG